MFPTFIRVLAAASVAVGALLNLPPYRTDADNGFYNQTVVFGTVADDRIEQPTGIALDPQGNLILADAGLGRAQRRAADGKLLQQWATFSSGSISLRFTQPAGVAVAGDGTIYVVDSAAKTVYVFSAAGVYKSSIGREGAGNGEYLRPVGVAVDAKGNVYVTDADGASVQKFASDGRFLLKIGSRGVGNGQFRTPLSVAVDGADAIYVVDSGNDRIQKFGSDGAFVWQVGSTGVGDGQFHAPTGLALDRTGNVLVADSGNARIQRFDPQGKLLSIWTTPAIWLAYGLSGVWAVDSTTGRVNRLNDSGAVVGGWGSQGTAKGSLRAPNAVALMTTGEVVVADTNNHRIQVFDAAGTFLNAFGSLGVGNGELNTPMGVATDASGNIYVADTNNNRVEKFDSSGKYITKWSATDSSASQLFHPAAVAVNNGAVIVLDAGNGRVVSFNTNGQFLQAWGSSGSAPGQFVRPTGLAVDGAGNIFVADPGGPTIQRFSVGGALLQRWTGADLGGASPQGIAVDSAGNMYVSDRTPLQSATVQIPHELVLKLNPSGVLLNVIGAVGFELGLLNGPAGLAVSSTLDVYVADSLNQRVQKFVFTSPLSPPPVPSAPQNPVTAPGGGGPVAPSAPPQGFSGGSGGPKLVSPASGAVLTDLKVVVQWSNPSDTNQVHVQVAPSGGDGPGIDLIIGDSGQVGSQVLAISAPVMGRGPYILLPDMTYFWRVRTSTATASLPADSSEWSPWSELATFHTPARAASSIKPVAPQDSDRISDSFTTLTWANGQTDVFYYELQLSRDPGFNTDPTQALAAVYWVLLHGGQSSPNNSWVTPQLDPSSFYYWRVRPRIQGDGRPVPWSGVWSFKTP